MRQRSTPYNLWWVVLSVIIIATIVMGLIIRPNIAENIAQLATTARLPSTSSDVASHSGQKSSEATSQPQMRPLEVGIAFPRGGSRSAYSATDSIWNDGLPTMQQQTQAKWILLTVRFFEPTATSTDVYADYGTTTPADLATGIARAHQNGLHVYVEPLLTLRYGSNTWGGSISFADLKSQQAWFTSYWDMYKPYVTAAAQAHVDQLAIGAELQGMESASPALWKQLITSIHAIYAGPLTYNMNHSSLYSAPPSWMSDPSLTYLGVSAYISLVDSSTILTREDISLVWQRTVLPLLDTLANRTGKPVLLSELGYRNAEDALYLPWLGTTNAPRDPNLQADAYAAGLDAVASDPHLVGVFFWGWGQGVFTPSLAAGWSVRLFCASHTCT